MAKLSAEAKVGLLVLAGSIILLYMTFAVGKYEFGEKKGYLITAEFNSVAGLDVKSAVRMAGVKIGTVEKIELNDSRAKVTLRIYPDVKIPRDSEAAVKTMGLMGEKYVEIIPSGVSSSGQDPQDPPERAPYVEEGQRIEVTVSPSDVDRLVNQLSAIADDIKQVTNSLRQVLGTEKGARSMEEILADLRRTTANIQEFSYALRSDGSELVMRLNELAMNLNAVVNENRDNLKMTMEDVREAARNAELAMTSIEDITRKIDQGQGTMGKLVNDESMYRNVDTAAKGLSDYASRIERMRTIVGGRIEYMFPESKGYFTLELKPVPDKYYILEVNTDPFARFTRTVTTKAPGSTTTTDTYEDKFRFSVEFAKRWGNLALRMGLIESKGGLAADYFAFDDRVKFSLDSWNYNSKEPGNENPHLKATVNVALSKLLFVNGGYDNFLNPERKAAFAGIGLRFDDEDLKYLLGSVPVPR